MVNTAIGRGLYWTGGPFQVSLQHPTTASPESVRDALASLEEFRVACQRQYIAFDRTVNGRDRAYELWKNLVALRENLIGVGTAPPGIPATDQRPGHSCIAQLRQGELLDGLAPGGWFGAEHAKAFIVTIFSVWEGRHRQEVANAMSVQKNQVRCTLMNEIRHVRNCIVHRKAVVSNGVVAKLVLLSQVWRITPGELRITEEMLHGLMEQINALRVEVVPQLSLGTTRCFERSRP